MKSTMPYFAFLILSALVCLVGCKQPVAKELQKSPQNLVAIRKAYLKATARLGAPPRTLDQMSAELKEQGDPDTLLRSPEDNEKYVIHFGAVADANPAQVIAYEKVGKEGKRYVLFGHIVWFMTDDELKSKKFPAGYSAP